MTQNGWWWGGLLVLAVVPLPVRAVAQETIPAPRLGVVAGVFSYDLDGQGATGLAGLRLALPLSSLVGMGASFQYAKYRGELSGEGAPMDPFDVPLLFVDFHVRGRYPFGRSAPTLGIGTGGMMDRRDDRRGRKFVELTYSAFAGIEVALTPRLESLAEVRLRGIGGFNAHVRELVFGMFWVL